MKACGLSSLAWLQLLTSPSRLLARENLHHSHFCGSHWPGALPPPCLCPCCSLCLDSMIPSSLPSLQNHDLHLPSGHSLNATSSMKLFQILLPRINLFLPEFQLHFTCSSLISTQHSWHCIIIICVFVLSPLLNYKLCWGRKPCLNHFTFTTMCLVQGRCSVHVD